MTQVPYGAEDSQILRAALQNQFPGDLASGICPPLTQLLWIENFYHFLAFCVCVCVSSSSLLLFFTAQVHAFSCLISSHLLHGLPVLCFPRLFFKWPLPILGYLLAVVSIFSSGKIQPFQDCSNFMSAGRPTSLLPVGIYSQISFRWQHCALLNSVFQDTYRFMACMFGETVILCYPSRVDQWQDCLRRLQQ